MLNHQLCAGSGRGRVSFFLTQRTQVYVACKEHDQGEDYEDEHDANKESIYNLFDKAKEKDSI